MLQTMLSRQQFSLRNDEHNDARGSPGLMNLMQSLEKAFAELDSIIPQWPEAIEAAGKVK